MDVKIGIVLLAVCCFKHTNGLSHGDEHSEMDELRAMLTESRDQNRRLEQQMSRLKLVWAGLQKMCSVLSAPSCTCEDDSWISSTTKQPSQTGRVLRILSATSGGNEIGDITLSVTYTASATHSTNWILQYDGVGGQGNVVRATGNTTGLGDNKYKNTIVARSHQLVALGLSLYSENETATVTFTEMFGKPSLQTVPEPKTTVIQVDIRNNDSSSTDENDIAYPVSQLNASDFTALNIEFIFNKTYAELSQMPHVSVSLASLKKTDETPSQYEIYNVFNGADGNIEYSTHPVTSTSSKCVITLKPPLTEQGGMLTVNFPLEAFGLEDIQQDLLSQITYGYAIPIRPELIPENTVALINITETTLMTAPELTITCVAMGKPTPVVQMFRESADGRRKKLPVEVSGFDKWIRGAYYTLEASDKKIPGTYICRAESGTAVAEERTEVVVYEAVTFDDARTAVIKNNSKKVVFGCKVKGREKPQLQFRLYDQYGPDLALMENYANLKVSEPKSGKTTSRIQLTISPPNSDIHTVYCVSQLHGIEENRKLELFPGTYPGWNYSLYNRGSNSTQPYDDNTVYPYYNTTDDTYPSYNVSFL